MKKLLLISVALLFLQGCSAAAYNNYVKKINAEKNERAKKTVSVESKQYHPKDENLYYFVASSFIPTGQQQPDRYDINSQIIEPRTESNNYGEMYSYNGEKSLLLSEVVSKMADQLLYNFPKEHHHETIALTSIVDLNDHTTTNWLGQTISEQFIHELYIRKFNILDFKLTGNIQLTQSGEFALTRDWTKLNKNINVQRILTGTMSRNEEGVILNVRIVNAENNLVESTSSAFIPRSMFSGGQYEYRSKTYFSRDSRLVNGRRAQVRLVN